MDVKLIIADLRKQYSVHYPKSGIRCLLHRIGVTYKQTNAVPIQSNERAQQAFLEERLPE